MVWFITKINRAPSLPLIYTNCTYDSIQITLRIYNINYQASKLILIEKKTFVRIPNKLINDKFQSPNQFILVENLNNNK